MPAPHPTGFDAPRLGLAVSGGADSSALAVLAAESRRGKYTCILHASHGRTYGESPEDSRAVRSLAGKLGLPFFEIPLKFRRRRGESPEMAARRARMDAFRDFSKRLSLDAIATGHHADDVAETLLLRLVRGGGATGLSGLRPRSELPGLVLVRPLLDKTHEELKAVLRKRGISWREDPTNTDESIRRNLMRHTVIPWLEKNVDPAIRRHLAQSAEILREDDSALETEATALLYRMTDADGRLVPGPLLKAPKALRRRAARMFLHNLGKPGGLRDTEEFLAKAEREARFTDMPREFVLVVTPLRGIVPGSKGIGAFPAVCSVSAAALAGRTLEMRPRRDGDKIRPTGFGHAKKLKRVFIDEKVPPEIRDRLPVLADADTGEVIWVPGYRVAASAAVPDDNARSYKLTLARPSPVPAKATAQRQAP